MAYDPDEGPFDEEPESAVPARLSGGHWEQASDKRWYAFAQTIGPGTGFRYQHPYDPNFWASQKDVKPDATGSGSWTCRHGTVWVGLGACHFGCPSRPAQFIPPTDEEVEEAGQALAALLASMESK